MDVRMDQALQPYSANAACPKCGHADIGTTHYPACGRAGCPWHAEHLGRNCLRCGYRWPEAVLPRG